ncbi:MAG: UDP-N-acetylmuramoyl-L-alanine--D-glutamate ligase [Anaerolineaceae bacterium]|jgi:UDP-N-acetylmuramoylalanine--D-glutamate ligase|nr:MAG: UDP-N-acetylmuramoyl-L-alanine--D-glutamate ligase [Anaerolineaceae bacterium]
MKNWTNTHVLILGAARQGIALARWLARRASHVTLSDSRPAEAFASAQASLADLNVSWALGGHPLELLEETDVLCLSGGVPLTLPIVREAVKRGIPLSNDSQIFMEVAPCKTIGITGSAGKTTTTTLVGEMAKLMYGKRAFVGGNIGDPLINYVDEMTAEDLAIMELSSFQLDQMTISPNIAAILNITPNHLDRHGTMEAYIQAKARILDFQSASDIAILGRDDAGAWNLRDRAKGKLFTFSLRDLEEDLNGAYLQDGLLSLRDGFAYVPLLLREKVQLRGDHNIANVLAAFAIGHAAGFKLDAMLEAVEEFRGVPHRLELIRELNGVRWYNDSISTAPERSMAAVHAFEEPIVLLLGGRDKNLPWGDLARLVCERVDHLVVFGEAGEMIQKIVAGVGGERGVDIRRAKTLKEAVALAAEVASAGDVVLLSPGGTSFDEFKDFAERGEAFRTWVRELS